jgi:SAM-dependent methyltransferase
MMSLYPGSELDAMSCAVNYHKWIVDEFEPYLGETVAEVGAGIGSISALLLENNIRRLVAFEPSSNMYPFLKEKLRHEARAKTVNDFFSHQYMPDGFDSIVYINILEHIEDDRSCLVNALSALKQNGHVLLFVPALEFLYSDMDKIMGHFRRYTIQQLSCLIKDVGFSLVKAHYFDIAGIIPWYINFVLLKGSFGQRSVSLYDRLVVPPMKLLENAIPPLIGKNIILIARKI